MRAVLQSKPLAAAITANNKIIHSYANGVIDEIECSKPVYHEDGGENLNPINHAVLIVGYGYDDATKLNYWLIKNSWNTTWGDEGYFRVAMDSDVSICGIRTYVMFFTD